MRKLIFVLMLSVLLLGFSSDSMAYDSILFPYFTTGGGNMTFIQIINASPVSAPIVGTTQGYLNYVYVYTTDEELCVHYDDKGRTTMNDILLYEVSGQVDLSGSVQLLPGDITSTSPTLTVSPAWGYLIVEQNSGSFDTGLEGEIMGMAFVVNVDSGTVFVYNAINDPDETDGVNEFDYNADDEHIISWLPETYASSTFYLFPVTGEDLTDQVTWTFVDVGDDPFDSGDGVYDNNESLKSVRKTIPVGCYCYDEDDPENYGFGCEYEMVPVTATYFFYSLSQIMNTAQYNAVKGTGGWSGIYWWDYGYPYNIMTSNLFGKPMDTMIYQTQYDYESSYTK